MAGLEARWSTQIHMGLRLGASRISPYTSSEEFQDFSAEAQSKHKMKKPCAKQSLSTRHEDNSALQMYLKGLLGTGCSIRNPWDCNRLSCLPLTGVKRAVIKWTRHDIHTPTCCCNQITLSQTIKDDCVHISNSKLPWLLTATTYDWSSSLCRVQGVSEQICNSYKCNGSDGSSSNTDFWLNFSHCLWGFWKQPSAQTSYQNLCCLSHKPYLC